MSNITSQGRTANTSFGSTGKQELERTTSHSTLDRQNAATSLDSVEQTGNALEFDEAARATERYPSQRPVDRIPTADRPYSVFKPYQKALIVLIVTLGACFSGFTANVYLPAIDIISNALGVSVSQVNLTITTYMIFQGVAPSFTSAIADETGRRPTYVLGFFLYLCANLGLGLNNSYVGLIILRCLQASGSSALVTLAQGTIADIVTSAERGKYIAITSIAGILAPSLGPIAGGLLADNLGWHSIFWFLLIASGVYFVILFCFIPETSRKLVGDGSLRPPVWNQNLVDCIKTRKIADAEKAEAEREAEEARKRPRHHHINPFATLSVVADPETALLLVTIAINYAAFYAISTSLTVQFGKIYNLDATIQGLLFLPQALGALSAAIFNTNVVDRNYRRHALRLGLSTDKSKQINILKSSMPIERARLEIVIPLVTISGISIIIYGWLLQAQVSIAGPLVMLAVNGFLALAGFSILSVLVIDLHRNRSATASAANNLVRCLLGAAASGIVNPMIDSIGNGWSFTIWGLLVAASSGLLFTCIAHGPRMRKQRIEKEEQKTEKREAEAKDVGGNSQSHSRRWWRSRGQSSRCS